MLFKKTQMFFNEPDYVTVHSVLNIMTANGATITAQKNASIVFNLVRKALLQTHNDTCCGLVKLLYLYFCYLILLNHG